MLQDRILLLQFCILCANHCTVAAILEAWLPQRMPLPCLTTCPQDFPRPCFGSLNAQVPRPPLLQVRPSPSKHCHLSKPRTLPTKYLLCSGWSCMLSCIYYRSLVTPNPTLCRTCHVTTIFSSTCGMSMVYLPAPALALLWMWSEGVEGFQNIFQQHWSSAFHSFAVAFLCCYNYVVHTVSQQKMCEFLHENIWPCPYVAYILFNVIFTVYWCSWGGMSVPNLLNRFSCCHAVG